MSPGRVDVSQLYGKERMSDVAVVFADGTRIPGHRCVLGLAAKTAEHCLFDEAIAAIDDAQREAAFDLSSYPADAAKIFVRLAYAASVAPKDIMSNFVDLVVVLHAMDAARPLRRVLEVFKKAARSRESAGEIDDDVQRLWGVSCDWPFYATDGITKKFKEPLLIGIRLALAFHAIKPTMPWMPLLFFLEEAPLDHVLRYQGEIQRDVVANLEDEKEALGRATDLARVKRTGSAIPKIVGQVLESMTESAAYPTVAGVLAGALARAVRGDDVILTHESRVAKRKREAEEIREDERKRAREDAIVVDGPRENDASSSSVEDDDDSLFRKDVWTGRSD